MPASNDIRLGLAFRQALFIHFNNIRAAPHQGTFIAALFGSRAATQANLPPTDCPLAARG